MAACPNMPRCDGCRNCSQGLLFEQRTARLLKCSVRDHQRGWRIRRPGIIDPLHFRSKCCVFGLGVGDIHGRPDPHQRVEFSCGFTLQANAPMRVWCGMHKTLMKTVGGSELTPITHGISDVTPRPTASGRNYSIALHAESVRSRAFVLLFRINTEIASGRWFRGHTNRNGRRHQATVAFHYINVFPRERNFHAHG